MFITLVLLTAFSSPLSTAFAQGTAFNYQGNLTDSGQPANNKYDLNFTLWSASSAGSGSQVGLTQTSLNTPVTNGLFTVVLDFSASPPNPPNTSNPFTGAPLWLQVGVRLSSSGPSGAFTEMSPLQPILSSPYAIFAGTSGALSGTLPAAQLSGTIPVAQLPATVLTENESGTLAKLTLSGALDLPETQVSPDIIYSGTTFLLYADNNGNFFSGQQAGASTTTTSGGMNNTGSGVSALASNTSGSGNTVLMRSSATQTARKIRPSARMRFATILPAPTIQPKGFSPFTTTRAATITSRWGISPVSASLPAATTLMLGIMVWRVTTTSSASAPKATKLTRSLPAFMASRSPAVSRWSSIHPVSLVPAVLSRVKVFRSV
jgi:hypothetical protein